MPALFVRPARNLHVMKTLNCIRWIKTITECRIKGGGGHKLTGVEIEKSLGGCHYGFS